MRPKDDERLVDLAMWFGDGKLSSYPGNGRKLPEVSVGRTDSERGLGFCVDVGKEPAWNNSRGKFVTFVLDRDQAKALREFLRIQILRLRKPAKGGTR